MDKVCIGIPAYGRQEPAFWKPLVEQAAVLYKQNIELVELLDTSAMQAAAARNDISRRFLETSADWLWWVDADNANPMGTLRRLLDHGKSLVAGLYFARNLDKPVPIAYNRLPDGRYKSIEDWRRGEVVPADAAGMNCLLSHRSVYEDIDKNYIALMREDGGIVPVHKDDIDELPEGDWEDADDNKVVRGVWKQRLFLPPDGNKVPFFSFSFGRTEDVPFFQMATRVGHKLWIDTSIEADHLATYTVDGKDYRKWRKSVS